ncbi:hypothetical protein GCM10025780_33820 [Frondihabitans cladoniiphilus]|uniref:HNH nuclease domain-containing protein n=1 Tax=Frondihabitans cladoniiphilus TaxID=715785 RepID=A0ABP8WCE9_9MICO
MRRAENIRITHKTGLFSKKGPVSLWIGKKEVIPFRKIPKDQFAGWIAASNEQPVLLGKSGDRNYWLFQGQWHWDNDGLSADQIHALIVTRTQRRDATIRRAQTMVAMAQEPVASRRGAIPGDLRQLVWQRDRGQCRQCGSNTELQMDHIIPIAYGGATNEDNLQILCGPCNRRKGASVA